MSRWFSRVWLAFVAFLPASASFAQETPIRTVIDKAMRKTWDEKKIVPQPKADDAAFLRRVTLDLTGTIPTYDEAKKFLADTDPKKREKLVDRLLEDPRYAVQQANQWDYLFFGRNPPNGDAVRKRDEFKTWLQGRFAKNQPWDELARDFLHGQEESSLFFIQYRNNVEETTVAVTKLFMGTQVQCARCHDHPYEPITQRDFFGVAGFFARLVYLDGGGKGTMKYRLGEKSTGDVLFTGSVKDLKPGQKGEPVKPKFLHGDALVEPTLPTDFKEVDVKTVKDMPRPVFSRKEKFVEWLIKPENPYFTRAIVNRIWATYMGRGLVHPVDDLSDKNVPSHPELFDTLTKSFASHKFDVKWLIREIVNSDAYQLDCGGALTDALPAYFERARVRPLSAEEVIDSLRVATVYDVGMKPGENKLPPNMMEYTIRFMGEPSNGRGDFQASLSEHLFMNNSNLFTQLIAPGGGKKGTLLETLTTSKESVDAKVDRLYLSMLTRLPSAQEKERFVAFLSSTANAKESPVRDAIWVLMNCAEFRFNH